MCYNGLIASGCIGQPSKIRLRLCVVMPERGLGRDRDARKGRDWRRSIVYRFYDYRRDEERPARPMKRIDWDRLTPSGSTEPPAAESETERTFWGSAEKLRALAEALGGCLLASVGGDGIGRITLRCRELLHTDDELEDTRFLLSKLFLQYETIYLRSVDDALELNIIQDLRK